jgi:uncharacterized protein DUF6065/sulfotransferase family protein
MNLSCYRIREHAPELVPGRAERAWMNAAGQRFPYRCTPLTVANATGWELLCPTGLTATWNGGARIEDLTVKVDDVRPDEPAFAQSHFGFGVISFHPGYLFRTDPEWAIWCRGAPNFPKDGLLPLDGLVETDWLPFSFTMNWLFTRPGTIRFETGEPFCFILPVPHMELEAIQPRILRLSDNPELLAEHAAWSSARAEFNKGLAANDPATVKERWQRFYLNGQSPTGLTAPDTHRVKRKMQPAIAARAKLPAPAAAPPAVARPQPQPGPAAPTPPTPRPEAPAPASTEPTAQNIIWVASYPKSGNTWVRVLLHNLLREMNEPATEALDINRLSETTAWEIPAAPYARLLGKPVSEAALREIAEIRPRVQARLAASRAQPFLVKTHLCLGNDWQTPTVNLDATLAAVYIIRNPLDVAISYAHHSAITIDAMIATMATSGFRTMGNNNNVYEVLGSWSEHVASWVGLNQRPVHILRYEDLIANPLRSLATLARFLGLEPDDDQMKAAVARSSFAEMSRQETENGFKERPPTAKVFFREGRAGQWRDVLTPGQIAEIMRAHAPMMQRFGYLPPKAGARLELSVGAAS